MVYFGKVKNGKIELEKRRTLPEGSRVRIEPVLDTADPADNLASLAVDLGIRDLAAQHDHYIYGTPKKKAARKVARRTRGGKGKR